MFASRSLYSSSSEYVPYGPGYGVTGAEAFQYTGKLLDLTGLYYEGARYYDPETGRFVTEDSVAGSSEDPMSLNRYVYARDNPMKIVDMNGHEWWDPVADLVSAAVGDLAGAASNVANGVSNAWTSLPPQDQAIVVTVGTDALAVGAVVSVPLTGGFTAPLASAAVGAAISTTAYTVFSGSSATGRGALAAAGVGAVTGIVSFGVGGAIAGAIGGTGISGAVAAAGGAFAGNFAGGVVQTLATGSGLDVHSLMQITLNSAITAGLAGGAGLLVGATGLSAVGRPASSLSTLWTGLTSPEEAPKAAFQVYGNPYYGVYSTAATFIAHEANIAMSH